MAALTSLLVRDRIVSVHKIEAALQQQVLEGGEIDTVLLELEAVPEDVLGAYKAATLGLGAVSSREVMETTSDALNAMPKEIAEQYRLAPVTLQSGKLTVASSKPLPDTVLGELKKRLGLEIECRITTEVRVETALAVHYGIEIPGRMRRLAAELERRDPGTVMTVDPLGENLAAQNERTIVDEFWATSAGREARDRANKPASSVPPRSESKAPAVAVAPSPKAISDAAPLRSASETPSGDSHLGADTEPSVFDERGTLKGLKPLGEMLSDAPPAARQAHIAGERSGERTDKGWTDVNLTIRTDRSGVSGWPSQKSVNQAPVSNGMRPSLRSPSERPGGPRKVKPHGALTPGVVDELLRSARDRDAILEVFFSFSRQYFSCAALFAFRESRAFGMFSFGLDDAKNIRAVSLPLEEDSSLLDVQRALFGGVIDLSRHKADTGLVEALGRIKQQPSMLLPVCIRRRPVLGLYGDRGGERFGLEDIADIIDLLPKVSLALEGIIQARKFADVAFKRASSLPPPTSLTPPSRDITEVSAEKKNEIASVEGSNPEISAKKQPVAGLETQASEAERGEVSEPASSTSEPPQIGPRDSSPVRTTQDKPRRPRLGGIVSDLLQRFKPSQAPAGAVSSGRPERSTEGMRSEPSVVVNLQSLTRELVEKLCNCERDREGPIVAALERAGERALPELVKRFPGPLWIKQRQAGAPLPSGRDVSAVARALLFFGDEAIEPIGELLARPDSKVYYYALLLARELPCDALIQPVAKHLWDSDLEIRRTTYEVLWQFRGVAGFEQIVNSLNEVASQRERNLDERIVAVEALEGLRDGSHLQLLSNLLEGPDTGLIEAVHRALVSITLQDFGTSARKWTSWIEENANRQRGEWLIDSLTHWDETIRASAGSELAYLTQQYFGYRASSPKRDRERIQQKYRDWWKTNRSG